MLVTVLSYNNFAGLMKSNNVDDSTVNINHKDVIFISILDTAGKFSERQFKEDHTNVLTLQFDDVTKDGEPSPTNKSSTTKAFTDVDAKKIINLLDTNIGAKFCVVHCAAGISRSGAVGSFINDRFASNYFDFMSRNPMLHPNPMITRKLNNASRN